ncbi:MAG: HAMP domain-containing histidine kinase [Clostridia bacterium]|nr:HAMP domain-containing histidine kinase [Clostridia bacterium]
MNNRKLSTKLSFVVFACILAANIVTGVTFVFLLQNGFFRVWHLTSLFLIALLFLASTAIGSIAAIFMSRFILQPVDNLCKAMEKVKKGDYSATVEPTDRRIASNLTIAQLEDSFNAMTAELRNTELMRKDFISNFSHEFKTPIASVKGMAKQLYAGEVSEEQQSEFLKIIYEESARLADLSDEILLLTRLEKQQIIPEQHEYSLDEQLRRCLLLYEETWSRKELDIDMDLEEITYHSNEDLLAHVWNNLFGNAVKFTPQNGSLRVVAKKTDKDIVVQIADSGIGMSKETQEHIFDKFYQGDASHTTPGNGLGLALVKKILTLAGGFIEVESEVGTGSTFTVHLPVETKTERR